MKKTLIRTGIALGFIVVFLGATLVAVTAQNNIHHSIFLPIDHQKFDMIIFVSPQYSNDIEIETVIEEYIAAVKIDLKWNIKIISLTKENNDYKMIDAILESNYKYHNIKAAVMVGEDIDTAFAGDSDFMEKISTVPWYTIGGEKSYEISDHGIVSKPYVMDICISLLYPTSTLEYHLKKSYIIDAFNKFSNQRDVVFDSDILVFENSDINKYSKEIYQKLGSFEKLFYKEDPSGVEVKNSLEKQYSMYYVHGHSNPAGTDINEWFSAENVNDINSPFFAADGCYVNGWWSDKEDNNILDASIDATWYGSKIFSSASIQVMVLGLLSQDGYSYPVSFLENAAPELINGETLAESMIGKYYIGDSVLIFGDPTFHYVN